MKKIVLCLLIGFFGSSGFAVTSVSEACDKIITGSQNLGSGMSIKVANYRRLCVELAGERGLTVQDLNGSGCNSRLGEFFGTNPLQGYKCLQARFGGGSTESSHRKKAANNLSCDVTYSSLADQNNLNAWKKDSFSMIDDQVGKTKVYKIGATQLKLQVQLVDKVGSIEWKVGNVTGFAEGHEYARASLAANEVQFHIECGLE